LGGSTHGIEFLREAVASCGETRLAAPLAELKGYIEEQLKTSASHQEEFQELLQLCDSTLNTLHSQTPLDEH
jgi:hypothetical protein